VNGSSAGGTSVSDQISYIAPIFVLHTEITMALTSLPKRNELKYWSGYHHLLVSLRVLQLSFSL